MDTFIEQLVVIKSTAKTNALKIAIWCGALLLSAGLVILGAMYEALTFFALLVVAAVFYVAYVLTVRFNQEFEYINTNGEIDIDRIINKKDRQRMATFKCMEIENIEKYNKAIHSQSKSDYSKNVYFGCTPDDNSLAFTIRHPKKGAYILVISPNEQFKESMKKFLPYILKNKI